MISSAKLKDIFCDNMRAKKLAVRLHLTHVVTKNEYKKILMTIHHRVERTEGASA